MTASKLKTCPFCGRQMIFHRDEHINKYGKKTVEQYYMHEEKEAECILDELCMPLVIGAGDATDDYIGEYAELWNRRAGAETGMSLKLSDRLTSKNIQGDNIILTSGERTHIVRQGTLIIWGRVADRLAAYEDTGLTPKEIAAMKSDNERLHKLVDTTQKLLWGDNQ